MIIEILLVLIIVLLGIMFYFNLKGQKTGTRDLEDAPFTPRDVNLSRGSEGSDGELNVRRTKKSHLEQDSLTRLQCSEKI